MFVGRTSTYFSTVNDFLPIIVFSSTVILKAGVSHASPMNRFLKFGFGRYNYSPAYSGYGPILTLEGRGTNFPCFCKGIR